VGIGLFRSGCCGVSSHIIHREEAFVHPFSRPNQQNSAADTDAKWCLHPSLIHPLRYPTLRLSGVFAPRSRVARGRGAERSWGKTRRADDEAARAQKSLPTEAPPIVRARSPAFYVA